MSRRAWWIGGFLGVTTLAVGAELVAALDGSPDTVPWTELLTDLPPWVAMPAALVLAVWLPVHLWSWYRRRRAQPSIVPRRYDMQPDPNTAPSEPLVSVGGITAVATAVVGLLVTFGLDLSAGKQAAILGVVGVAAPLVVALWGRRKVYAPSTVAKLLAAARR